jgi:hypothetical protein
MSLLSYLSKPFAKWVVKRQQAKFKDPVKVQKEVLEKLLITAKDTLWGHIFKFESIKSYMQFRERVPIKPYEDLAEYIAMVKKGDQHIFWPERPLCFAQTSGTTEGSKYIPISNEGIKHHITNARNALLYYINETGRTDFIRQQMLFLSGSPELLPYGPFPAARLSGLVYHEIPFYLRSKVQPDYFTNIIKNWEEKLNKIVKITLKKKLSLISGIPPWVQMYFDNLMEATGKKVGDIFPDFSLLVHGGVRFSPYRTKLAASIGRAVPTIETYPASEGFIAFQHSQESESMLLQLDSGIFFEFIPVWDLRRYRPIRLSIGEVEVGVDYAVVLSTNSGLWAYPLGDTIRFTSLNPPQIIITGRTKQFTSAFGEHVIVEEVEGTMWRTLPQHPSAKVAEYTVAPVVSQKAGQDSYHEWLIEFEQEPADMAAFASQLNENLCMCNKYYKDLIVGHILEPLKITKIRPDGFKDYMQAAGKIGEQHKVVRIANDRTIADQLLPYHLANTDPIVRR